MEHLISLLFSILFFISYSGALINNERFKVHVGYRVNTVDETITVKSAPMCAAVCSARNGVTANSCVTSTFNTVTKECLLSSKGMSEATSGLGTSYKTMANEADCSKPPPINNGVLTIISQILTGSIATLTCNTGYNLGTNSPLIAQCSEIIGWMTNGISCTLPPETTYYGTSFVFGYIANGNTNSGSPTFIVTCPQGEAIVTISIPHLSVSEQVTTNDGLLTKQYVRTLTSDTSGSITSRGVFVTTDVPVTIFVGNMKTGGSDGSLILPETSLGSSYIISGHTSTSSGQDEYIVVGTSDTTQIVLNSNSGLSELITLNRMQTYYKRASDMSGTIINASAPVFVLSGHVCANIPDNSVLYCDHIESAIPPIPSLGTVHILSYMKPRSDFTISVVAPYNQTSVRISDHLGNQIDTFVLQETNSEFKTYTESATISVTSDLPILVTQYGHGSALVLRDPSMMIIPDISFFGHVYDFSVPTGFDDPSTLQIVISNSYPVSGLNLNGLSLSPTQTVSITTEHHGIVTVVYVDVVMGKYRLTHSLESSASFGAWLYGRTYNQEYSTNLGIKVG